MGRSEPFWRTNSSFSPPISRRWDQRFQSEGLSHGSSISSNSKESRSWVRGEHFLNHTCSASDYDVSYSSSPSDSFQTQHLTPPQVQGVNIDEYVSATLKEPSSGRFSFPRYAEGTSGIPNSVGSISSRSDGSEGEAIAKNHVHSQLNFSTRYSFMSKPVHPFSFPDETLEGEEAYGSSAATNSNATSHSDPKSVRQLADLQSLSGFLDFSAPERETSRWSSSNSIDFTDVSEPVEIECSGFSLDDTFEGGKCGLCERFLSQRSPWSSRRIVRSADMPIAGVLACLHVYHAECLERTTPKTHKHDPPCPLCEKSEGDLPEQWVICRLKNGPPRLRSLGEEGPSRAWSCGQVGDCVEGALHVPSRNNMVLLNRSRMRRHLSLKAGSGKEQAEKSRRSVLCPSQLLDGRRLMDQGAVGCSRTVPGSALKRW